MRDKQPLLGLLTVKVHLDEPTLEDVGFRATVKTPMIGSPT